MNRLSRIDKLGHLREGSGAGFWVKLSSGLVSRVCMAGIVSRGWSKFACPFLIGNPLGCNKKVTVLHSDHYTHV